MGGRTERGMPVLLAAMIVTIASACASGGDFRDAFEADVRAARQSAEVVVPVTLPPRLTEAWVTDADGVPLVSFYSANDPVVTICTGTAPRCGRLVGDGSLLRSEDVEGRPVVVSLGVSDDPGAGPPGLRRELRSFWADVDLTASVPGWLADRAAAPHVRPDPPTNGKSGCPNVGRSEGAAPGLVRAWSKIDLWGHMPHC